VPNLPRNVLAVRAGIAIGGVVNMALISLSPWLIPPADVDVSSDAGLSKAMHLFQPWHFIMPFLAHAAVGGFDRSWTFYEGDRQAAGVGAA